MTKIKSNELVYSDGVVIALDQKLANDIDTALDFYMDCSTDYMVGVMELDLDGGYDHRLTTNVPTNAVIYHTRDVCQVIAITKYKADAQHIACAMNLYYTFVDHGLNWLETTNSSRLDLCVHDK
tara:strand:+ start:1181 stop:1552 length:372 start_codon:yes stop_codon:yes gene_type:complete